MRPRMVCCVHLLFFFVLRIIEERQVGNHRRILVCQDARILFGEDKPCEDVISAGRGARRRRLLLCRARRPSSSLLVEGTSEGLACRYRKRVQPQSWRRFNRHDRHFQRIGNGGTSTPAFGGFGNGSEMAPLRNSSRRNDKAPWS